MLHIPVEEVKTIDEYIHILPPKANYKLWGYRGQSEDWPLVPKLFRPSFLPDKLKQNISTIEKLWLDKFKAYSIPHLISVPTSDFAWLALAQHHGMGTRLLDWTESPLIALFFAVENEVKLDAVVWAISVADGIRETEDSLKKLDDRQLSQEFYKYHPSHTTARITAQQGFFTVQAFSSTASFEPLEIQFQSAITPLNFILKKFLIPHDRKRDLKYDLDKMGINYYSVYPDLDGISKKLNWDIEMVRGI